MFWIALVFNINFSGLVHNECSIVTYAKNLYFFYLTACLKIIWLNDSPLWRMWASDSLAFVFRNHIATNVTDLLKAYDFVVLNCKKFSNAESLRNLYLAWMKSNLGYARIVWNPIHACYIYEIAKIQHKFLKLLCFKINDIYPKL